ncbi:MAG: metal ABC transporter solute-binding protein, Zn/Mn family, partial [Bacteroidota bacterium]
MKKVLLLISVGIFLLSCTSNKKQSQDQEKPVVTVSILPQKTFIEKIAGDDFNIQVLVPHGASPESYTLLPSQLKEISRSEVWFGIGHIGFELSWKEKIEEINNDMKVVDLSEGMDLIRGEEIDHGDHVHIGGIDPHIWMSPKLVKQMAQKITDVLVELH